MCNIRTVYFIIVKRATGEEVKSGRFGEEKQRVFSLIKLIHFELFAYLGKWLYTYEQGYYENPNKIILDSRG